MISGSALNIRHLRTFVAVYDTGTTAAACLVANLSQPAISQAISKLEVQLEVQLFSRFSTGMAPTHEAGILYRRVQRFLVFLEEAVALANKTGLNRKRISTSSAITNTQLKAVIAIGKHGSFTGAARDVGTSQPSLLRSARDLERLLDTKLFVRNSKGVDLNSIARKFVRLIRVGILELDIGLEEISNSQDGETGSLRIGALPLSRSVLLPSAINSLLDEKPMAKISTQDGTYKDLLFALRHGEIDLILGAIREEQRSQDVVQHKLFDDHLGVFCHPDHAMNAKSAAPEFLAKQTWIVARKGTPARTHFDTFCELSFGNLRPQMVETGSLSIVRGLLGSPFRLAVVSKLQSQKDVEMKAMVELPIALNDPPRSIGYTIRSDWSPTAIQSAFIDILKSKATLICQQRQNIESE